MQFIAATASSIGSSVAAAAAVAQFVSNEVESSAPVQAVQAIKKLTANQIIKKMQGLESALSILKEQLIASCVMDKNGEAIEKKRKEPKEKKEKEPKEKKEKEPKEKKEKKLKEVVIVDENKKKQNKIPMPWTGVVDYTTCVALKTMYGLFIQCAKECDMTSASFQIDNHECRFCSDCSKKCDENGKHPVGTVEERIEAGVGKYVNDKTGKKEASYIEVLEKMSITKEEALDAAKKRGVQIPDWMFEPVEKKRGRPAKMDVDVASTVEKAPKPVKEKKEKKEKKVASVETADTPEKADDGVEKKKRGRPTKTVQQSNVGEDDMRQLILQATAAKKKRLSFDPSDVEIAPVPIQFDDDEDNETVSVVSTEEEEQETSTAAAAVPPGNVDEADEDEDGFFNFDDEEQEAQQQQEQVQQQEQEVVVVLAAPVEPEKKKKKEKKEKAEKAEKKDKKEKKEKKVKANKNEGEEEAAADKNKLKKAEKKEETPKESCIEGFYVEAEQVEDEEEELECEEYEYEGETYGLASDGDLYTQEGEHVGKVVNGEVIFNRAAVASKRR
jgi:hypothetical protein